MAVVSVRLHWHGQAGSKTPGKRSYTAVYLVKTDDPSDGAQVVLGASGLPSLSTSTYSFGNDSDAEAVCVELSPRRQHRLLWEVSCTFETPGDSERNENEDGDETEDPLEWRSEVDIRSQKISKPVEKAWNLIAFPGRPAGTLGPVTNSAGTILNPPLEREISLEVITRTSNFATFPVASQAIENHINSDPFTLRDAGYVKDVARHEALCDSVGGSLNFTNGVFYWRVTKILILHPDFWDPEVVDRGMFVAADDGVIASSPGDVQSGTTPLIAAQDEYGNQFQEPILLNGQGLPQPRGLPAIYLKYQIYPEADFAPHF